VNLVKALAGKAGTVLASIVILAVFCVMAPIILTIAAFDGSKFEMRGDTLHIRLNAYLFTMSTLMIGVWLYVVLVEFHLRTMLSAAPVLVIFALPATFYGVAKLLASLRRKRTAQII